MGKLIKILNQSSKEGIGKKVIGNNNMFESAIYYK
jgi:hypothetical protein